MVRDLWKAIFIYCTGLILALVLLPATLVGGWWRWTEEKEKEKAASLAEKDGEKEGRGNIFLRLYNVENGEIIVLELEEYLVGAVAAEMPASFGLEALKAQAVAARTYALQKREAGGGKGCLSHPGADLCSDSSCCQAWEKIEATAGDKWPPEKRDYYLDKILEAVESTRGMVITYGKEVIRAVYHSTCGGMTESAEDAFNGPPYPYLRSVECSYCSHSPYYRKEISFKINTYAAALKDDDGVIPVLGEENVPLLETLSRSQTGRNLLLRVGKPGRLIRGAELRSLLGLPSTHFRWRVEGEEIIFSTRGYGHGVGMCQYGADGMAGEGKDYVQIIQYYYPGVEVEEYSGTLSASTSGQ